MFLMDFKKSPEYFLFGILEKKNCRRPVQTEENYLHIEIKE